MKNLLISLCFFTVIATAQEESLFEIKDNLFNVGLFHEISLSDKLTLQNGLEIRKHLYFTTAGIPAYFATLEIPIIIKYDLSNEWSTFFSVQTRPFQYLCSANFNDIEAPSNSYLSIGTEYEFKNNAAANFTIAFPSHLQLYLQF